MKHITSKDNPLVKQLRLLAQPGAQRRQPDRALLDGVHLAQAYLDGVGQPLHCVVSDAGLAHPEVAALAARVDADRQVCLPAALFRGLSTLAHGLDLLFVIAVPVGNSPSRQQTDCVVLDAIQDAGNVGSILRSAAAAGVRDIYCTPGTAACWSPKVLRAGMGAHFLLNIIEHCAAETLAPRLDVSVYATSSHARETVFAQDLSRPACWIFGNEGAGVSAPWQALVTQPVAIPQPGGMESLNVAACAAVCLFEMVRQRSAQ